MRPFGTDAGSSTARQHVQVALVKSLVDPLKRLRLSAALFFSRHTLAASRHRPALEPGAPVVLQPWASQISRRRSERS
jgi:hypothetical protein